MVSKNFSSNEEFVHKNYKKDVSQISNHEEDEYIVVESEEKGSSNGEPKKGSNDDFKDLNELRLSRDFSAEMNVKKLLTTIPVKKPDKQKFIRVNPDTSYNFTVATIEVKEDNETYIVHPKILPELVGEYNNKLLVVAITRQQVLFVWPIGLPGADGKDNPWHRSAREAAEYAKGRWVRVVSNRELGAYEIYEAEGNLGEPEFPDLSMDEIIRIAFKDKVISDLDHPLLQQLRGI